jgi:hypothetical protein
MKLPGLDKLIETCQRLHYTLKILPPGRHPPRAGTVIAGHPFDPMLAALYSRLGQAIFATNVVGMGTFLVDDNVNSLEQENKEWQRDYQSEINMPLFVFGGETGLAYYYATVPGLADPQGIQPVVRVCSYEQPYALPLASSVDRFFDTYASYFEALVSHPDYSENDPRPLTFPWHIPQVLAHDSRLVELLRAGHFDPLVTKGSEAAQWVEQILRLST